jgi:transcriptional regulator with XRE-family HTH domain
MRGKELKLKRESLDLTESEMAERLGLSIERYRSWEGDREALGDEIRSLLRLAIEKVEIDIAAAEGRKSKL